MDGTGAGHLYGQHAVGGAVQKRSGSIVQLGQGIEGTGGGGQRCEADVHYVVGLYAEAVRNHICNIVHRHAGHGVTEVDGSGANRVVQILQGELVVAGLGVVLIPYHDPVGTS